MKLERTIVTTLLCAVLALSSACKKASVGVDIVEGEAPVEFYAKSQATWVKSETTSTTQTFPHVNFGVWGMARLGEDAIYNLWGNNSLAEVNKNTTTGIFEPEVDAYWLKGYAYNFIAVAPYNDSGYSFISASPAATANPLDHVSFTYDISGKYATTDYTFDLLGAAADSDGPVSGGRTASQDLTFWHLLSKIIITIQFGKDAQGNSINAVVNTVKISPIPSGVYTLSYDCESTAYTAPLVIQCSPNTSASKQTVTFNPNPAKATVGPLNVIPQNVSTIGLEIDFTINEGTAQNPISVPYTGFNIDLNVPGKVDTLDPNGQYNYTITIGAKAGITFEVDVQEWTPVENIPEINM